MTTEIIAYITDAHLGQQLQWENEIGSGKMSYRNEPDEHKENLILILNDLTKRGITQVVFGGDIGSGPSNQWFFDLVREHRLKLRMVLGNHDTFAEVNRHYKNDLLHGHSEMYYAHEDSHFKYIYLDSSSNAISGVQLNWLKQALNTHRKVILFIHHPVLAIDTPLDSAGADLKGRETIKQVLHESGKEIVIFCGHYNMNDERADGNIRQFLTPAAAYQILKQAKTILTDNQTFGYRIIEISGDEVKTEVVSILLDPEITL